MKVRLGDVCSFFSGTGFPNIYQGQKTGKYPIYKVGDISKNVLFGNRELIFSDNYIDDDTVKAIKGTVLPPKTVVFAKIGEALKLNRRAITGCYCLIDNNAMGILADNSVLDELYFYYFMCSVDLQHYCESTAVPSVRKARISEIEIPLPPLDEQRRIAAVLDKVSDLIAKRRAQLDKLDDLVKARFVEMFENSNHQYHTLISLIVEGAGLSYGIVQPGDDGTGDMGVIRPVDLVDGKISTASIKYIDRAISNGFKKTELTGDELLITVRGTTGITALTDKRFKGMNVTRGIAVVRYDRSKINPIYLNVYLNTDESQHYIQEHTKGATLRQINLFDLRKQEILVPPMELQSKMASFVTKIDKSKLTIQQSLDKLEMLKKALMQVYFG